MKLNRIPVIDISTGHLTGGTRDWMSLMAEQGKLGIMEREEGFFMATVHVDHDDGPDLPPDLYHCLTFASVNKVQYVLFDRDAQPQPGLPLYQERQLKHQVEGMSLPYHPLVEDHEYIRIDGLEPDLQLWLDPTVQMHRALLAYAPGSFDPEDLRIEKSGPVLEDEEFEIESGCWLTMGNASIRICEPSDSEDSVRITVLPKGFEDIGAEFVFVEVDQSDLGEEIENLKRAREAEDADNGPEM